MTQPGAGQAAQEGGLPRSNATRPDRSAMALPGRPPIDARDLLRFATIGDPMALDWLDQEGMGRPAVPAIASPDGRWSLIVVRNGNPERETNEARILLIDMSDPLSARGPTELVRLATSGPAQPIAFVRWLADSRTIVFAGSDGTDNMRVFGIDIRTRELRPLTENRPGLQWFGVDDRGGQVVTLVARRNTPPGERSECQRYGCIAPADSYFETEAGGSDRRTDGTIYEVATNRSRPLVQIEELDRELHFCDPELAGGISPDGRYAIRYCRLHSPFIPRWWGDYAMSPLYRQCFETANARCWRRGFIIDLAANRARAWDVAPHSNLGSAKPIWIDGGRYAILPQALEPLEGLASGERERRAATYVVQLLEPQMGRTTIIARLPAGVASVTNASWDAAAQQLRIDLRDARYSALPSFYLRRTGGLWHTATAASGRTLPSVSGRFEIQQSFDRPPVLISVDGRTGRRTEILDPNPWLASRAIGRVQLFRWTTRSGRNWFGGLYYPPNFQPGRRYPLVIQTHGFDQRRYSLSGIARNFPGEALAARDMFVLQVSEGEALLDVTQSPQFWEASREGYEAAIDRLSDQGLIDRQHVGIIGWSYTGNSSSYLLTHSDYPIAAAAFTDSAAEGWLEHLVTGGSQHPSARFGTMPFGAGLEPWLELSPTFSLDRMQAPFLLTAAGGFLGDWDFFAGLRSLRKPVEFWSFPTGAHDVLQASQRLRLNQLLIDWFCFWLGDDERNVAGIYRNDTPEALAQQYERWRALRELHRVDVARGRPPLLDWSARPRINASGPSGTR